MEGHLRFLRKFNMYQTEYTKDKFNLRIEARVKNAQLVGAREILGLSQKEAAEKMGITQYTLGDIERMSYYPEMNLQTKICGFYRNNGVFLFEDDVFPEELKHIKGRKYTAERDISKHDILSLSYEGTRLLSAASDKAVEEVHKIELKDEINYALSKLSYREREVLKLRFGFKDNRYHTLEECAEVFHVSRERIRQIEAKGLRRLRHPNISERLKEQLQV